MLPPHAMVTTKNPRRGLVPVVCCALALAVLLSACTPPGPKALLRGKELMDKGQYAQALPELQAAVELLPTNALAWHYLGLASQKTGQTNEAERAYQHALAINRDLTEARFNLGCLYLDANRVEEAKAQFTAYNLRKGNSIEGLLKLGSTQLRAQEPTSAERTFTEALRVSPQNPEALNGLGLARLQRGRGQEAAQAFFNLTRSQPNYGPAWLNLAIVRQQYLKDREGALQAYRQYVSLRPPPANAVEVLEVIEQLQRELGPQLAAQQPATFTPPTNSVASPTAPAARPEPVEKPLTTSRPVPSAPASSPVAQASPGIVARTPSAAQPQSQTRAEVPQAEPKPKLLANAAPPRQSIPPVSRPEPRELPPERSQAPAPVATRNQAQPGPSQAPKAPDRSAQPPPAAQQTVVSTNEPSLPVARDTTAPTVTRPDSRPQTVAQHPNSGLVITTSTVPGQVSSKPKRGILQALNPANLFKGEEKSQGGSPRPAAAPGQVNTQNASPAGSPQTQANAPSKIPKPEPRYQYRRPAKPIPGDRKEAERALAQGLQAHAGGKLEAAMQAYRAAAQADPAFFEAHYNLGLAAGEAGNLAVALAAYEDALAILPTSLDARYNLALMLRHGGYFVDAAQELERLVEQYPNDTRVRLALGKLYADHKQIVKARVHYSKVLELEPRHPQAAAIRSWMVINPAPSP